MIDFGHGSHVGLRRDHNEDTYCADPRLGLWLVADGMGGHEHGEVASALARDIVLEEIRAGKPLADAIVAADSRIIELSRQRAENLPMGTTVAAARLREERFEVAWVGDSRVYLYRQGALDQLSNDHSYVQELVDQGAITAQQARVHPHRNVVTQALGVTEPDALQVDTAQGTLEEGMMLLLCSDGLTEEVSDDDILDILEAQITTQERVDQLILAALDAGGSDNVTVLLIENRREDKAD